MRKIKYMAMGALLCLCGVVIFHETLLEPVGHIRAAKAQPDNSVLPECGEVCSYNGRIRTGIKNDYPQLTKFINCPNILGRMAWDKYDVIYPPPKSPPVELLKEFTQYGMMPLSTASYRIDFTPNMTKVYIRSKEAFETLQRNDRAGKVISTYETGRVLSETLHNYSHWINGTQGFVVGTRSPWVEAILVNLGTHHITTLEYAQVKIQHPQVTVFHPAAFAQKYLKDQTPPFDFGVSFSSIEHSGLGRYGDPLNPYGDLEAMAQAWCMTKLGGLFFLGLPHTKKMSKPSSYLQWNSHRVYGPSRLSHVTANWELIDIRKSRDFHVLLVLKRIP